MDIEKLSWQEIQNIINKWDIYSHGLWCRIIRK
jgi:hypothetical protein